MKTNYQHIKQMNIKQLAEFIRYSKLEIMQNIECWDEQQITKWLKRKLRA